MKVDSNKMLYFGLDIGTRTVVGVVGHSDGNNFTVVDYECISHQERAMLDGQIHDIQKVSQVVSHVKEALERRLNTPLKEVSIAAAGRSLKTQNIEITQYFDVEKEISISDIQSLEFQGIEKAKAQQQVLHQDEEYHCVAYSVTQYYLEDYIISNLEGHRGSYIKAHLIATFLPRQVIDSLYAVTSRADLSVANLTLEPIAAINAIIPDQIRLLNLAIVDIGAGTSDIAITKDGSVIAYGMLPIAGDEITEALIHKYLVDFQMAERMKYQLSIQDDVTFVDIIGLEHCKKSTELKEMIIPAIEHLTKQIANQIIELNGGNAPNAIFCVGGGSQMLDVPKRLAKHLSMPDERVALRSVAHISHLNDQIGTIDSPEMITPLGICITTMKQKAHSWIHIMLNGEDIALLNTKKLTILDAIIAAGVAHSSIIASRGSTLMYKLEGKRYRIKGSVGEHAKLWQNSREASLKDTIKDGDIIDIEFAIPGETPRITLADLVPIDQEVLLNGEKYELPLVYVNDLLTSREYHLLPNDDINVVHILTVDDLKRHLSDIQERHPEPIEDSSIGIHEVCTQPPSTSNKINSTDKTILPSALEVERDEYYISENIHIIVNGQTLCLPYISEGYILARIFDFIDFDLSKPQGIVQLIKNGKPSSLVDEVQTGDILEIYWKK